MEERRAQGRVAARTGALICAPALALAGCGGGDERQDANEPAGSYSVEVVRAGFPAEHTLATRSSMVIAVRNADSKEIPNVAVTLKGADGAPAFDYKKDAPELADPQRPVFVVNRIPRGSETAHVGTFGLGRLKAGETRVFRWSVTAVRPGTYRISYRVAAGLDGKAKAVLASGQPPTGVFAGTIDERAPEARVAADGVTVVKRQPREE